MSVQQASDVKGTEANFCVTTERRAKGAGLLYVDFLSLLLCLSALGVLANEKRNATSR